MTDQQLIKFVKSFRKGVLGRKGPEGMCFMVSAPLQTLLEKSGVECFLIQVGIVVGNCICSHYCLKLKDGRILDATASQFYGPKGEKMPEIYLGERPVWYQALRDGHCSELKSKKRAYNKHL